MADRLDYYFRQKVTEAELDLAFELLEKADRNLAADIGVYGIISGAEPTPHSPVPDLTIDLTAPGRAYDNLGQRIFFGTGQTVDCAVDFAGIPTEVPSAGQERWLGIFLKFDRLLSDPRTDGNSQQVFFRRDESFEIVVRQAPPGPIGSAAKVPLQPDELLVCDVRRGNGQTQILAPDIDTVRRQAFIFAEGDAVQVVSGGWTTLQPAVDTVQSSLDEVDAEVTDHFTGAARRGPRRLRPRRRRRLPHRRRGHRPPRRGHGRRLGRGAALDREGGTLQLRLQRPARHRPRLLQAPRHARGLTDRPPGGARRVVRREPPGPTTPEDKMNKENKKRMRIMEELRLPELQARFHDIVGEATRSPNKKFLLRRIAEALEAQEQEAAEAASAVEETEPTTSEPTTANGEPKLTKLSVEELQHLYTEVVGRNTGSSDRRYVEPGDMWSRCFARRVLPRRARETTPHNRAPFSGRMTLRFPRPEACMATGAASWRSQGERA